MISWCLRALRRRPENIKVILWRRSIFKNMDLLVPLNIPVYRFPDPILVRINVISGTGCLEGDSRHKLEVIKGLKAYQELILSYKSYFLLRCFIEFRLTDRTLHGVFTLSFSLTWLSLEWASFNAYICLFLNCSIRK